MTATIDYQTAQAHRRELQRELRELDHLPRHAHVYRVRSLCRQWLRAELDLLEGELEGTGESARRLPSRPIIWHSRPPRTAWWQRAVKIITTALTKTPDALAWALMAFFAAYLVWEAMR